MNNLVSIILVNYNTKEITENCIDSIIEHTGEIDYEVIIVDNSSDDGSVGYFTEKYRAYQNIKCIQNEENIGFGGANNTGVDLAEGEYIFLLNSDTLLLNNAIKEFYDKACSGFQNRILGSYLRNTNKELTYSYSSFDNRKTILLKLIYLYIPVIYRIRRKVFPLKFNNVEEIEKDVDFVTGADMFMKKSIFDKVGGFDTNYFMYSEDQDFCLTANKLGINCRIICEPKIIHLDGGSSKFSKKKIKMQKDSLKYYIRKNILKKKKKAWDII